MFKQHPQGPSASKWQNENLNPGLSNLKVHVFQTIPLGVNNSQLILMPHTFIHACSLFYI